MYWRISLDSAALPLLDLAPSLHATGLGHMVGLLSGLTGNQSWRRPPAGDATAVSEQTDKAREAASHA